VASVTRKPRTEPREARRPEVERRLLTATEELIADGTSFTELSVEQLASRAGIARSTFYVYFRDKSDLVARLGEEMVHQLHEAANVWWKLGVNATYEDVLASTREVVDTYARHEALFTALAETAAYDERIRDMQLLTMSRYARPMSELIERGKDDGIVRPEVHTSETVVALTWMVERTCYHLARGASPERLERIAESLAQIFWHTLYPDTHDPQGEKK
jgi:AcrR family transcriptional regulator